MLNLRNSLGFYLFFVPLSFTYLNNHLQVFWNSLSTPSLTVTLTLLLISGLGLPLLLMAKPYLLTFLSLTFCYHHGSNIPWSCKWLLSWALAYRWQPLWSFSTMLMPLSQVCSLSFSKQHILWILQVFSPEDSMQSVFRPDVPVSMSHASFSKPIGFSFCQLPWESQMKVQAFLFHFHLYCFQGPNRNSTLVFPKVYFMYHGPVVSFHKALPSNIILHFIGFIWTFRILKVSWHW